MPSKSEMGHSHDENHVSRGVIIVTELLGGDVLVTLDLAGFGQRLLVGERHYKLLLLVLRRRQEVRRNAVPPPELAADAPVLDVPSPRLVRSGLETKSEMGWA